MNSWIFLRGLTREKEHWGKFKPMFEEGLKANVHCIDFPGVGGFYQQKSPKTIQEMTDHLILQSGEIQTQSWILAHSMGCLAALEWMQREPHRFFGAVFINTSLRKICPMFDRLKWTGILNFLKIGLSSDLRRKEELKFLLSSNANSIKVETVSEWVKIQQKHPVAVHTAWQQINAALTYQAAKPRYPVLILNSLGDNLVNSSCSKMIAEQWNLPIRTHSWSGHEITLDDPAWVVEQVSDWIKTPSGSF